MLLNLYLICAFLFFLYVNVKTWGNKNKEHFVGIAMVSIIAWWYFVIKELIEKDSNIKTDLGKLIFRFNLLISRFF